MQCICFAKFPSSFRKNDISWGFCSAPYVFAVWPRWCLMIRPSWRHRFSETRGGAFDLCRCGWINELGEPNATQFHKVSHRQNILGRLAGSFKKVNMCACVFSFVVFCFFVGRSLLLECFWQTAMFWSVVFFCNLPIRKCRLSLFCRCPS